MLVINYQSTIFPPPPTIDMEYSNSVPYACHTLPEHNLPFPPSLLTWNILTVCHMLVIHYQSTIFSPLPPLLPWHCAFIFTLNQLTHSSCQGKRKRLPYKPVVKGLTLNSKALRFESSLATKNFPISFCGAQKHFWMIDIIFYFFCRAPSRFHWILPIKMQRERLSFCKYLHVPR